MRVAVIGSRNLTVTHLEQYLPPQTSELVSGGAKGVDTCAKEYARCHGMRFTEILPEYEKYRKAAPLLRNLQIIAYADEVIAFWDGQSKGTKFVIDQCKKNGKKVTVYQNTCFGSL